MRVCVSGDGGYMGAVLVPYLQAAGHEVVGLDAGWYDGCDFGPPVAGYEQRRRLDIRDVEPADLEGFDAVVHLAAISNDPIGHLNPGATYSVNADGAIHVGADGQGRPASPRFLFSSSCSLYGAAGDAPVTETAEFNPVTPVRREQGPGRGGHLARSPTTTSARPTCATPPHTARRRGCAPTSSSTTSPARPFTRGEVRLQSDGTPWRPLVHAEDISAAFLAALEARASRPRPGLQRRARRGRRPDPRHRAARWRGSPAHR